MIRRNTKGVTLIEVIVGLAIFAMAMAGIYNLFNLATKMLGDNRARVDAIAMANKRIEMIRNLAYDNVGITGGIPNGTIPQTEQLVVNNITYTLETDIRYVDDPFDGTATGAPPDTNSADYKRIRIEVTWPRMLNNKPVILVTDVTPKGMEKTVGGGTILLTVFDALGQPVPSAAVHVENTDVNPIVNYDTTTQANGTLVLPGMPPSIETYDVRVTKVGYSTDQTYEIDPIANPNPTRPPLSVYLNVVTEASFSIDRLSTVNIQTFDQASQPLPNIDFTLRGSKTIGTDGVGAPIYKYSQAFTTNATGEITISDLEWDSYNFIIDNAGINYDIAGANPPLPINLDPDATQTTQISLATPHTNHTLLVTVRDQNMVLMPNIAVQLSRLVPPYDETQTTSAWGQTFFPSLVQGDYTIFIQATGYQDHNEVITIDGQRTIEIVMIPPI
ncbi:MAG: carboxypeptidase regulatory-like domain-containing protein [Patescibacteria group bacterium]|nr:carboxypeptidase regulatory-like domain-containing protein [Patescibacteria group bacterium]